MLKVGAHAPFCCGMTEDKAFYSFEAQAGRPAVLVMVGTLPAAAVERTIGTLAERAGFLLDRDTDLLLMIDGQGPHAQAFSAAAYPGCKPVFCLGSFFDAAGCSGLEPAVIVLDRSQRVLAVAGACETGAQADEVAAVVAQMPREAPRAVVLPAPVLMVPNLFDRTFCHDLIAAFEASDHVAGGVAGVDAAGRPVHRIDDAKKRRNDLVLRPEGETAQRVLATLATVCLAEMKKAFQFDAAFTDRLLIARYDDTGGYFRRHRDNVAPEVAFRQFALSVNLNADYEGGHLTFPEFNAHRYRPEPGSGIIFSASLLHEAMPVTRGRRYVLLTFFHNMEAQARRQAA